MPINEFRAIATFAKAVELGSIRQAALAQGVTPQAASQAIAQLELHLGVRLLHRTTRNLALTEEGQQFLENTQPAIAALDRALALAREAKDDIAGPLRIVGPKSSFAAILMPLLDAFCRTHPGIQPDIQLDDGIGNWVLDRVDVGFRIGASPNEGVIGRQLFPVQMIVCAAPAYLATHGVPATLDDLVTHRCSVYRHPATGKVAPWYLTVDGKVEHRQMSPAFSTNDSELELQAVLAGQAIGQLANFSAASHIRAGRLVPVLLPHMSAHIGLHIYYGSRAALPMRVREFLDLAIARLLDCADYVLSSKELAAASQGWRQAQRRR
ncbi:MULTISPECIES: LysR family transcriptional regulator [Ralstonia solanacearum species complex]|uniref:LysR family transcriptional regulator n=1 Tax=Ralstonia solanacearum species complex TaxID=3116862 RepID=UPI00078DEAA0|nr:LysR family transcriptional regulator [Ralstonia solanacearum]BEU74943.1 LysR family transcriptional regulator [Ralstonia pseudosolanacearum]AMP40323.1 LysR family transcriptional regulator [Ralstonia solanacearum]AXV79746.1 LysR family transcriptional regulator [Ralstonia solanacearum]AXV89183.1 LysR family transcriptional regulator [Ralstonia solanacearum]AXV93774.1 LysR family transcriptional regulator [Ralstonia solanacearum]